MRKKIRQTFLFVTLLASVVLTGPNCQRGLTSGQNNNQISLEEKIGQLLMVGFRGKSLEGNTLLQEQLQSGKIGGIILFDYDVQLKKADRNIESPAQVKTLIEQLQRQAKRPLFVAVDQEGGRVMRLKTRYGFPGLPSAQYLGRLDKLDSTAYYARVNAQNLAQLGFNVNFAPVVDVNLKPDNPVIGGIERSFSADTAAVVRHAAAVIRAQREQGVISVLKHFPGHGSSTADSHLGITDVSESWQRQELTPYRRLIEQGLVDAVMSAHVFNRKIDAQYPATLSRTAIDLLRQDMDYNGLIFSDDMQMKAIADEYGLEQAIALALNAGIDVIVFGNNLDYDPQLPDKFLTIVRQAVERGDIKMARIDEAYERVQAVKAKFFSEGR